MAIERAPPNAGLSSDVLEGSVDTETSEEALAGREQGVVVALRVGSECLGAGGHGAHGGILLDKRTLCPHHYRCKRTQCPNRRSSCRHRPSITRSFTSVSSCLTWTRWRSSKSHWGSS